MIDYVNLNSSIVINGGGGLQIRPAINTFYKLLVKLTNVGETLTKVNNLFAFDVDV